MVVYLLDGVFQQLPGSFCSPRHIARQPDARKAVQQVQECLTHLHTADPLPRDAAARSRRSSVSFCSSSVVRIASVESPWRVFSSCFARFQQGWSMRPLSTHLEGFDSESSLAWSGHRARTCPNVPSTSPHSPSTSRFGISLLPFQGRRSVRSVGRVRPSMDLGRVLAPRIRQDLGFRERSFEIS